MARKSPPLVLAIGGMDPSCGAGVIADARTLEACGALPLAVVTAISVQSGRGVQGVHPVSIAQVAAQLRELARLPIAAVKIGQVPTAACARAIAAELASMRAPVVLDPVLRASGGGTLATDSAARAIVRDLVPLATVVTVNLAEAAALTGLRVTSLAAMRAAAERLAAHGAAAVVIKGGHLRGAPVDLLWRAGDVRSFRSTRLAGSMHGTGCAFASALAAMLARGATLEDAVAAARAHVRELMRTAIKIGGATLRWSGRLR